MDLLTQQSNRIRIIPSIHQKLGDDTILWKQRVQQHFKIGIEFECNLMPNYKNCNVWVAKECQEKMCKCEADGSCQHEYKGKHQEPSKDRVCEIGPECRHFGNDCDTEKCGDFVGKDADPGPCSRQKCKDFEPYCERCGMNDAQSIRTHIQNILKPTKNPRCIGKYGVESVQNDGSLINGGVEVVTAGRHYDWNIIYNQNKAICNLLLESGGFVNGRCGGHMHTLLSYDPKWSERARVNHKPEIDVVNPDETYSEIETAIPSIICANIHQIVRRFAAELTWITCATAMPDGEITRYSQFRKGIIMENATDELSNQVKLLISPQNTEIIDIGTKLHQKFSGKYAMLNYDYCKFKPNKELAALHLEFRTPDMHFVPIAHTAIAGLLYAIWMKATDISEYGLMSAGEPEWMKEEIRLFQAINNMGKCCDHDGVRVIDNVHEEGRLSHPPDESEMRDLSLRSVSMLKFFKKQLLTINPDLYGILLSLAKEPIALRLHKKQSHNEIERHLSSIKMKEKPTNSYPNGIETKMIRIMNLGEIIAQDEDAWLSDVAQRFTEDYTEEYSINDIKKIITGIERYGVTHFDEDSGTFMFFQKGGIC